MDKAYECLVNGVKEKKIDRQLAIDLIKLLEGEKETVGDIAIIGMAAKLPSMQDIEEYWNVIENGVDCIAEFPDSRSGDITKYLKCKGIPESEISYNRSAYLEEIDKFDYKFFKFSPREASLMDPCQRMFLETSWHAIEDAGYGGKRLEGTKTGVYVGFAGNLRDMYLNMIQEVEPDGLSLSMIGNLTAVIPSRISYFLDLKGPNMVIDTACSSSLVAIDTACQALRNHVCDVAIAGGINVNTVPLNKDYAQTGIESTDGLSRTFDDYSNGSGIGEGIGAIILKPLKEALKDKDHIYAVIKGSAVNQDGRSPGITAPNRQAQTDVILQAWENAGVDPETIAYIETHGTGTNLGDPIEIQGIHSAFRKHTNKKQFCAVSSVKTNIGHLSEAAGIVSVMKAIKALNTKCIPPSLHFNKPNRSIPFEDLAVYVNTKPRYWEKKDQPRRCGVSAFGISGTNCHLILEEAPESASRRQVNATSPLLFTLSGKTEESLLELIKKYKDFLELNRHLNLGDVCYTVNTGRGHYSHRLAVIVESLDDLYEKLSDMDLHESGYSIYYGYHRSVDSIKEDLEKNELTERERERLSSIADSVIADCLKDKQISRHVQEIAQLYVQGANVEWELLFDDEKPAKVSLPVYPFERSKCWMKLPGDPSVQVEQESNSPPFYSLSWIPEELKDSQELVPIGEILVIKDPSSPEFVRLMIEKLKEQGHQVIEVTIESKYERLGSHSYTIANQAEDYDRLLADTRGYSITHLLHMCGLSKGQPAKTLAELEESQQIGVYSLFHLSKSLMRVDTKSKLHMLLFTSNLHSVTEKETAVFPEAAPFVGLGKVFSQEYTQIECKAIDVDNSTSVEAILPELQIFTHQYQVSYREGQRYVEEYGSVDPTSSQPVEWRIQDGCVYLITGGTGGIGLETAKYLASQANVNLALISRSLMPERECWASILLDNSEDDELKKKISTLKQIESMGSSVLLLQADVSDFAAMEQTIRRVRSEYGWIDGVIHGAGIAGAGYLYTKDFQLFRDVLKPKVTGTWILDMLTREDQLDFFVMHSSGVSLVGEAGQGDYVAGSSFLDAYASYRRKNNQHALTINWVSWKEAGMSVRYGINVDTFYKAIPTELAIKGLDAALKGNMTRVLIGEMNESPEYMSLLNALPFNMHPDLKEIQIRLLNGNIEHTSDGVASNGQYDSALLDKGKLIILPKGKVPIHKNILSKGVTLKGKQEDSYNDVEKELAIIFGEILGYPEIDIHDSLFELGGDSLILMRIHKLVEDKYPGKVTLTDMFEYPSVQRLASHINKQVEEPTPEKAKDMRQEARDTFGMLAEGTLSLEDAIQRLEEL